MATKTNVLNRSDFVFCAETLTPRERFILQMADNGLMMNHRLCEWCSHAPELELEMSLANIGLDHLGQTRLWFKALERSLAKRNLFTHEDRLAFFREETEFFNLLLLEQKNGDFAMTLAKLFFYDVYQSALLQQIAQSSDKELAAIAQKSLIENGFHRQFSEHWFQVLAGGTDESRERIQEAINFLWQYCGEMFTPTEHEKNISLTLGLNFETLRESWQEIVFPHVKSSLDFDESFFSLDFFEPSGKNGHHTEYLGYILAEMQVLARKHPEAKW